jgi:hypothetical protein
MDLWHIVLCLSVKNLITHRKQINQFFLWVSFITATTHLPGKLVLLPYNSLLSFTKRWHLVHLRGALWHQSSLLLLFIDKLCAMTITLTHIIKHAHTHTHTHTLTHSYTLYLLQTFMHKHHTHSLSLSFTHTFTQSHTHKLLSRYEVCERIWVFKSSVLMVE